MIDVRDDDSLTGISVTSMEGTPKLIAERAKKSPEFNVWVEDITRIRTTASLEVYEVRFGSHFNKAPFRTVLTSDNPYKLSKLLVQNGFPQPALYM